MTQVVSLEARFRATGVQDVKNGFKEIERAAKAAIAQEKELAKTQKEAQRWQQSVDRQRMQQVNQNIAFQKRYARAIEQQAQADKAYTTSILTKWAAAAAVVGIATKKVYELGKAGAQIEYTSIKFDRLAKAAGSTGDVFLQDLRYATKGTISDFKAMELGANLLQLGLSKNTKEAGRLAGVMTAMGMDVGEVTLALANQSTRRLDQLGISLTKFNEIKEQLKRENPNLSNADLFTEAFLRTGEQTIATTGNMADSQAGQFMKFEAAKENIGNTAKMNIADILAEPLGGIADWMLARQTRKNEETVLERMAKLREKGGEYDVMQMGDEQLSNVARTQMRNEAYNRAMKNRVETERKAGLATADSVKYSLALTDAQQKMKTVQEELNSKLAEEQALLYQLQERYGENSTKVREQAEAVKQAQEEQAQGYTQLAETHRDNTNNMMMDMIGIAAGEEMAAQKQLDFAFATGQVSKEAFEQQKAMQAVADAYANNEMTAEAAANAVNLIIAAVGQADGMSADMFINLIVNGEVPKIVDGQIITGSTGGGHGSSAATVSASDYVAKASGGAFSGWAITGDSHAGLTPHSELVYAPHGAYVYNASQTRNMLANGMGGVDRYASGGAIMLDGALPVATTRPSDLGIFTSPTTSGGGGSPAAVVAEVVAPAIGALANITAQQQSQLTNTMTALDIRTMETNRLLAVIAERVATAPDIGRAVNSDRSKYS